MTSADDVMDALGSLALGSRLKRLSDQLMSEVAAIYERSDVSLNPRFFPFLNALHQRGEMGVMELSKSLNLTHPAVSQMVKPLESEGWIEVREAATDARCRRLTLTPHATKTIEQITPLWRKIRAAIDEVLAATGCDFVETLGKIEDELNRKSLADRVFQDPRPTATDGHVVISEWNPRYEASFVDLNLEWIEKYFFVEKLDRELFKDPAQVVKGGGQIFFAKLGASVVGTCGIVKHSKTHYELMRFAVSPLAQNRGIGRKLVEHAIAWARLKGASVLSLESAKSLAAAQRLYRSLGFVEVPLPSEGSKYKRVDVKMELGLHAASVR